MREKASAFTACKEAVLEGITICSGISIGEASIVSEDIAIPRIQIISRQIDEEQKRYGI